MGTQNATDEITLDGRRFVSVKRAASLSGYTTDYVGQLCRGDKIEATRVGRNWYVYEDSIIEHKQNNTDFGEGAQKETTVSRVSPKGIFKSSFIVYERDERPLLPELREKEIPAPKSVRVEELGDDVVPTDIFTTPIEQKSPFSVARIIKRASIPVAAVLVFMALFSLNGSYTAGLLGTGAQNVGAAALSTEFGKTFHDDIIEPYAHVAKVIHETVDDAVYGLLYEDVDPQ